MKLNLTLDHFEGKEILHYLIRMMIIEHFSTLRFTCCCYEMQLNALDILMSISRVILGAKHRCFYLFDKGEFRITHIPEDTNTTNKKSTTIVIDKFVDH